MPAGLTILCHPWLPRVSAAPGEAARHPYLARLPINYLQHRSPLCSFPSECFSNMASVLFCSPKSREVIYPHLLVNKWYRAIG